LLKTRPQADARLTISPSCVARLFDSCVYLWEEIGFTNVVMADSAYELWTDEDIATYDRQIGLLVDYLAADFEAGGKKNIAVLSIFMKRLVMPRDKSTQIERRNFPCGAGYNYSMIDHKGDIWPCHRFDGAAEDSGTEESMRMGNIFNGSYNDKLSNVFRNFDHSKVFKPPCKTCPVEPICGGFCPAANLQHNGDLYRPHDVYCSLKWILYRHAEILYKRLNNISATRAEEFLRDVRETSETA
jgi:radical SAM protein with 4Fe4S-binding SPASM domain